MAGAYGARVSGRRYARASVLVFDYLKLAKYRLSGLVAITAGAGYFMRADRDDNGNASPLFWRKACATTVGTYLTAAAANTLNQMYEIRSDSLMCRTRLRPLPTGRVSFVRAGVFAIATAASGLAILLHETNTTTAGLAGANLVLYAAVYTPLKAVSTMNTWVGAIVGALPPMLGWAAASEGRLFGERERGAWALGSTLFLWQIPHFHALAAVARADYAAGGLKMLAVTNPSANAVWAQVTAAMLVPTGFALAACDITTDLFAWESVVLGAWMYRKASCLSQAPTSFSAARALFRISILHLPVTLILMMAHRTSPVEIRAAHKQRIEGESLLRQRHGVHEKSPVKCYHPWLIHAPFPFLPLPVMIPAAVIPIDERSQNKDFA